MKTAFRIVIILTVVLAVAGGLYAVGQSEWATAQLASDRPAMTEGAEGGRPMPDVSSAAATLGVTTAASTAAICKPLGAVPSRQSVRRRQVILRCRSSVRWRPS